MRVLVGSCSLRQHREEVEELIGTKKRNICSDGSVVGIISLGLFQGVVLRDLIRFSWLP